MLRFYALGGGGTVVLCVVLSVCCSTVMAQKADTALPPVTVEARESAPGGSTGEKAAASGDRLCEAQEANCHRCRQSTGTASRRLAPTRRLASRLS